jgi:GT2 family glycosyltransferase
MELSIIIVNWNSVDYVRECLSSIYEFTHGPEFEVVVVDNASSDSNVDDLLKDFPAIKIAKSAKNLVFNYFLGKIRMLPDAGVVGFKLFNSDLSTQLSSIQKFPKILNQVLDIDFLQKRWPGCPLWDISPLFSEKHGTFKVEMISGACMLLHRPVFAEVGMFSEEYFMYAEDIDLNYKVHQSGFQNYYVASSSIIHHGGGSSSRQSMNQWKTLMKYRAMRMYYQKMYGRSYEGMYRVSMGFSAALRLILLAIVYPISIVLRRKSAVAGALEKWRTIFNWAIGVQQIRPDEK